jgi:hypothetical protein
VTIEGNVFGECHAPCTLKTSFVVLKRVGVYIAATKLNCSSLHNSSYCSSLHNSSYCPLHFTQSINLNNQINQYN